MLVDNHEKHTIAYREILVLLMQGYIATLYLQEKLQEGITFQKIKHTVDKFTSIIFKVNADYIHRDILLASFFSNIGTAIYYKNLVLPQKVNELWLDTKLVHTNLLERAIEDIPDTFENAIEDIPDTITEEEENNIHELKKCFPASIDKLFLLQSADEVNKISPNVIRFDSRISTTSYVYYKLTLQKLLGSKSNKMIDLLKECSRLIRSSDDKKYPEQSYRSLQPIHRLTAIGNALAKIGDYLLPVVQRKDVIVTDALGCFYKRVYFESHDKKNVYSSCFLRADLSAKSLTTIARLRKFGMHNNINTETEAREILLFSYFENMVHIDLNPKETGIHPRLVVHIYYMAALFYLDAAETANAAFQLRKILVTLRSIKLKSVKTSESVSMALKTLEENLVKRILELSSWMSHSSDRPQLSKMKKYFNINTLRTPHDTSSELYGSLSNNPDTKETILMYALLAVKYEEVNSYSATLTEHFAKFDEKNLINPYNNISHFIVRIMELELHTEINYKILKSYTEGNFQTLNTKVSREINFKLVRQSFSSQNEKSWEGNFYYASKLYDVNDENFIPRLEETERDGKHQKGRRAENELKEEELKKVLSNFDTLFKQDSEGQFHIWLDEYSNLVVNSVFNLLQIDKTINTYGTNYILSNSYLAQVHEHLGTWLKHLHLCRILIYRFDLEQAIPVDTMLNDLVGVQAASSLDALTSYQMAMQYYYKAIQLHKEGDSYRHQINSLIYLEDDFNDNLYHFGAALERLKINSGQIRKRIDYLKKELIKANMYKYSTYIGGRN